MMTMMLGFAAKSEGLSAKSKTARSRVMACKRAVEEAHCEEVLIHGRVASDAMRLLLFLLALCPSLVASQPNFLLVMVEDMSFSDYGACPFHRGGATPNTEPFDPKTHWDDSTGWAWARHSPFRIYKQNQFEGGISSPAILHWPAGLKWHDMAAKS